MNTASPSTHADGIGVSYHPFLHEALLAQADAFDFFELPLDFYADPARRSLTDMLGHGFAAVVAAKPCTWRGSLLSLGSVEPTMAAERLHSLMARTPGAPVTETIGFRRAGGIDLGLAFEMPRTEAAASHIAARYRQAADALGTTLLLQAAIPGLPAPPHEMDRARFLGRIAALSGCGLVVDAAELGRMAEEGATTPEDAAGRLGPVAVATLTGDTEADWANLAALVTHAGARSIVLRRDGRLFGIGTLRADADRARALLDACSTSTVPSNDVMVGLDPIHQRGSERPQTMFEQPASAIETGATGTGWMVGSSPGMTESDDLAALSTYQTDLAAYCLGTGSIPASLAAASAEARRGLATAVQSHRSWREQVDDMHKAQQLTAFFAADMRAQNPQVRR